MIRRNFFVILALSVILFTSGLVERLNRAWAQDATDVEQGEDASAQPTVTPPQIAGTWSGLATDNSFGMHTLSLDIFQKKAKIMGELLIDSVKQGAFKGKIAGDETTVTLLLKRHHCRVSATATLMSADTELKGMYTASHCNNASTGNFDLTKQ